MAIRISPIWPALQKYCKIAGFFLPFSFRVLTATLPYMTFNSPSNWFITTILLMNAL